MSSADVEKYLQKITQPACFGPGEWYCLYLLALDANNYTKKMQYIHNVEVILKGTLCEECKRDSLKYLQEHPLTKYWGLIVNGEDIGMFYWSVDFHNWVNEKLGKPKISRNIAYQFYKNPGDFICKEGCGDKESVVEPVSRPNETKKVFGFFPL